MLQAASQQKQNHMTNCDTFAVGKKYHLTKHSVIDNLGFWECITAVYNTIITQLLTGEDSKGAVLILHYCNYQSPDGTVLWWQAEHAISNFSSQFKIFLAESFLHPHCQEQGRPYSAKSKTNQKKHNLDIYASIRPVPRGYANEEDLQHSNADTPRCCVLKLPLPSSKKDAASLPAGDGEEYYLVTQTEDCVRQHTAGVPRCSAASTAVVSVCFAGSRPRFEFAFHTLTLQSAGLKQLEQSRG